MRKQHRMLRVCALALLVWFVPQSISAGVYNDVTPAPTIYPGGTFLAWNAQTPTPGNGTTAASQQVALASGDKASGSNTPFSVDGKFSGDPGVFEVDVQVAATDSDTNYQTCSGCNITSVDSTNFTFHLDAGQAVARYVRILMRTRTNSVSITARINR